MIHRRGYFSRPSFPSKIFLSLLCLAMAQIAIWNAPAAMKMAAGSACTPTAKAIQPQTCRGESGWRESRLSCCQLSEISPSTRPLLWSHLGGVVCACGDLEEEAPGDLVAPVARRPQVGQDDVTPKVAELAGDGHGKGNLGLELGRRRVEGVVDKVGDEGCEPLRVVFGSVAETGERANRFGASTWHAPNNMSSS